MTTFREYLERKSSGALEAEAIELSLPEAARPFQGERAGFATRIVACGIDVAIAAIVALGVWVCIFLVKVILSPGTEVTMPSFAWAIIVSYGFTWMYWTMAWATTGRTIGDWMMGLRIVDIHGNPLSWPLSALRSIFCVGFPFGLLWVLFSPSNRSLQDTVLRTSAIYDWAVDVAAIRPPVAAGSDAVPSPGSP